MGDKLVVVDHRNFYHLGSGPRILFRQHFLLVDDVAVFTGLGFLPAFDQEQLSNEIRPMAEAGIKVDRKTVMIKLLEAGHPLAKGAVATLASTLLAALLLLAA